MSRIGKTNGAVGGDLIKKKGMGIGKGQKAPSKCPAPALKKGIPTTKDNLPGR